MKSSRKSENRASWLQTTPVIEAEFTKAGYAAGRDLPVILTCRSDDMGNLHFDIRQYNCIDWKTPNELAQRLQVRIEAVIGEGPLKSS
jgi:hypothetical protein